MQLELPTRWQRDYDVYDRLEELGIDLGRREDAIAPETNRIPRLIFTPSGLLFFSGSGAGEGPVTNDETSVEKGHGAGRDVGHKHICVLHWGLHPFGTLNDVWYCVKCIGMVHSAHREESFTNAPRVVDGYTEVWHDVFGGPLSRRAKEGQPDGRSGWHGRSALGGFEISNLAIEPEMIVQVDPDLAIRVIRERGPHI